LELTIGLRPKLFDNEVELSFAASTLFTFGEKNISLEYHKQQNHTEQSPNANNNGCCMVTTHRILWIESDRKMPAAWAIPLGQVSKIVDDTGFFSARKLKISFVNVAGKQTPNDCKVTFSNTGKDETLRAAQSALDQKAFLKTAEQKEKEEMDNLRKQKGAFSTHSAGISGILRNVERLQLKTEFTLQDAFSDLDSLMKQAEQIAALAEKFVQKKAKERETASAVGSSLQHNLNSNSNSNSNSSLVNLSSSSSSSSSSQSESEQKNKEREDDDAFNNILHGMGIKSPVTKQSAGAAYHSQLSGQLADFLVVPLSKQGGMMTLTDVFCLFCRARGTEIISPEDLIRAAELFPAKGLPFRLRKFAESGVLVIQNDSHDDQKMCETILTLIKQHGSLSAAEISKLVTVSLMIAKQQLSIAEKRLLICRDDSVEGIRFYPNLFLK
jgi:ESCRT-II complex subunit VPS36